MADDNYKVDLSGLLNYVPFEGLGSNALLKADGLYTALVTKIVAGKSTGGHPKWTVQQIIQDEDEKGQNLVSTVIIGGVDKNGEPMIRQLGSFMSSVGMTVEKIKAFAQSAGTPDVKELAALFVNKTVFVEIESEFYDNRESSKVKNYVTPQAYTDAKAANAHRKPRRSAVTSSGPSTGASTGPLNVGGPGTNGAPKADPMSTLKGLNLPI